MRFRILLLVVIGFCPALSAADDPKAIVEKAIKASGASVDDPPNMTWKEKGTLAFMGQKLEYTSDWTVQFPDKCRFVMKADFGGMKVDIIVSSNGTKAWESAAGQSREMEAEKLGTFKQEIYQLWVLSLIPLVKEKGFRLSEIPGKDVSGKPAVGIRIEKESQRPISLFFDKESGLPVRYETITKDEFQNWKEVSEVAEITGWKKSGNRMEFAQVKIIRDGKPLIESQLSDAKYPKTVDSKLFEKP
jgi:outer membrane lipoprotein-sorting protein